MTRTEEMFKMVAAQSRSGRSKKAFAESKGMKLATFHYWCKRYREEHAEEKNGEFVPLAQSTERPEYEDASMLVVTLASGTRVEIR